MKTNYTFSILSFLLVFFYACKKETTTQIPIVKVEDEGCILKETNFKKDTTVHVWNVTDTTNGKAEAIKINKKWIGKANSYYFKGLISVSFYTFFDTKKDLYRREALSFNNIPKKIGCYELSTWNISNLDVPNASYYACDDDVVEARYNLDESLTKNYLEVTKIDTINNYIEGKFMATFLKNPKNKIKFYQDTLRFANASFWAKIQ